MSKALIAKCIQDNAQVSATCANRVMKALIVEIKEHIKKNGHFTIPTFGKYYVIKKRPRIGMNPRTGEKIDVPGGMTVHWKVSPILRKDVQKPSRRPAKRKLKEG